MKKCILKKMLITILIPLLLVFVITGEIINDSSKKVVSIIQTIEEIASQTNLLSLNASIDSTKDASLSQADSIRQINKGIELMTEVVESNSAAAVSFLEFRLTAFSGTAQGRVRYFF